MVATPEVLTDVFGRIREEVATVLEGIGPAILTWRPDDRANTVAWLVWHLTRVQDDHLADAFDRPQVWHEGDWYERMALPFDRGATGYGQSSGEVAQVVAGADLLLGYHEAVVARTLQLVATVSHADLDRVVDTRWDPPVTLGVRLVSVIGDDLQHVGQAAYVRGLAERAGAR
jgi:hypothetical protein